jgi:hypothetical protein
MTMTGDNNQSYSEKHGKHVKMDETIASAIRSRAKNNELPCAVAFDIASELGCTVDQIGLTADLLDYRLTKCQLGLFGYKPQKKIVGPEHPTDSGLEAALKEKAGPGAIPCRDVWELSAQFNVSKMAVSANCEALGIKVKPCQLGAF